MSKPFIHAISSAKKFGGIWEDYIEIHEFMDSSKAVMSDQRHRALTHNSWFISVVIPKIYGEVFARKSDGGKVSSRNVAEHHVVEDYNNKFIPAATDFLTKIPFVDWMQNGVKGYPDSYYELHKNKGIEYGADYSSNYTMRTLVDKGYVTEPEKEEHDIAPVDLTPEIEHLKPERRRGRLGGGSFVVD